MHTNNILDFLFTSAKMIVIISSRLIEYSGQDTNYASLHLPEKYFLVTLFKYVNNFLDAYRCGVVCKLYREFKTI